MWVCSAFGCTFAACMGRISFQSEYIGYNHPKKGVCRTWIRSVIAQEGRQMGLIQYIFCTDHYLLQINTEFLEHDFFTDIITFDYTSDNGAKISGDLFISVDRVRENSDKMKLEFNDEMSRVMLHGVLHLIGYEDKTKNQIAIIRAKENGYLARKSTL